MKKTNTKATLSTKSLVLPTSLLEESFDKKEANEKLPILDKNKIEAVSFEKLHQIPNIYYKSWLTRFGGEFEGKTILDFGCGEGLTSVGLSLFCNVEKVVGVDICEDFHGIEARLTKIDEELKLPNNVTFKKMIPCEPLGEEVFDVIVSWSVLEHVSQDIFDQQMATLVAALKPQGFCVVQIAPLYYSPFGSHLFNTCEAWDHITLQHNLLRDLVFKKFQDNIDVANNHWNCFTTLNKFTANEFINRIKTAGLNVLHVYETDTNFEPNNELSTIFNREILMKEQILLVCQKPIQISEIAQ